MYNTRAQHFMFISYGSPNNFQSICRKPQNNVSFKSDIHANSALGYIYENLGFIKRRKLLSGTYM